MERWIVCLKHGTKYSSDYVNKLFNMVKRHTTVPFNFACITEDTRGLDPAITIVPLPMHDKLEGWWYKPYIFSKDFPLSGELLFMDLDLVIIKNIDCLWDYTPENFCIIRDFTRSTNPDWKKFNSSIFRLASKSLPHVWDNLLKNLEVIRRFHGDQDWIFDQVVSNFNYWPDEWIQSYKWEIRSRSEITRVGAIRKFNSVKHPIINSNTKILVFHGEPKPEHVDDPIVVQNWR